MGRESAGPGDVAAVAQPHRPPPALRHTDDAAPINPGRSLWSDAWRRLRRDRISLVAGCVLLLFIALALAADLLSLDFFQRGFTQQDLLQSYTPPSLAEPSLWLGTDELGRSQIVRLLYGARISFAVGFGAALINLTIGVALGVTAGYFSGGVDDALQVVVSTLNSIPPLFLLLIVASLFTPGPIVLVLVLGALLWPNVTLYVRAQTLSLREREFIQAGRVVGASATRLMFHHILPNVLPLVFIVVAGDVGTIILVESALSYLGLGINPPTPSWGNMLSGAANDFTRGPWLAWGPGAMIFLTVLCLYLLGDGLRDALDPRSNRT